MCDARSGNSLQLDFGEGSFARSMQQNSCVLHVTTIYVESNCQSSRIVIGFKNLSTLRTISSINTQSMLSLGFLRVSPPDLLGICHPVADCQRGHVRTAMLVQAVAENQVAGDAPQICPSALPWSASRHLPSIF